MSDNIWSTLRMTVAMVKDDDAIDMVGRRDLDALCRKYDVQPIDSTAKQVEQEST